MKTLSLNANHQPLARHQDGERQVTRTFPRIDFPYQTTLSDVRAVAVSDARRCALRNFRILSRDFMDGETRRDYAREAALFAVVTALAAWPLWSLLRLIAEVARY